jgi:hypothetical protein
MTHSEGATETMAQRLIEAIEQVGADVWKVDVWASVLRGFASPVPVYEPGIWAHWGSPELPTGPMPAE